MTVVRAGRKAKHHSTLCEMCKHNYDWHLKHHPKHVFVGYVAL